MEGPGDRQVGMTMLLAPKTQLQNGPGRHRHEVEGRFTVSILPRGSPPPVPPPQPPKNQKKLPKGQDVKIEP